MSKGSLGVVLGGPRSFGYTGWAFCRVPLGSPWRDILGGEIYNPVMLNVYRSLLFGILCNLGDIGSDRRAEKELIQTPFDLFRKTENLCGTFDCILMR